MYENNKTAEWLKEKNSEKGHIINKAIRSNAEFINNSKLKQKLLHENRIKIIEDKRLNKKAIKMLKDLETIGMWKNKKNIRRKY